MPVAVFFLVLAAAIMTPGSFVRTANAQSLEIQALPEQYMFTLVQTLAEESASEAVAAAEAACLENPISTELIASMVLAEIKANELQLMTSATDHIVNYHGNRFAITDDEYQVLLKIVEAEAGTEDLTGRILVANVVLNRLEIGFGGDTISEVVFSEGQFQPVSDGRFFTVTPSEKTIEAVERVLRGEDESQGALYFMARDKASWRGARWFDKNLKFLFKHGGHEFFTEKNK